MPGFSRRRAGPSAGPRRARRPFHRAGPQQRRDGPAEPPAPPPGRGIGLSAGLGLSERLRGSGWDGTRGGQERAAGRLRARRCLRSPNRAGPPHRRPVRRHRTVPARGGSGAGGSPARVGRHGSVSSVPFVPAAQPTLGSPLAVAATRNREPGAGLPRSAGHGARPGREHAPSPPRAPGRAGLGRAAPAGPPPPPAPLLLVVLLAVELAVPEVAAGGERLLARGAL